VKLALSSLLLGAASAFACGPFFPNTVLDQPAETLQAVPVATFARELEPLRFPTNFRATSNDTAIATQDDRRAAELNSQPLAEFADYQRGADLWRDGNTNDARAAWIALLKRPAAERRYRSTWAAFMIGKSHLAGDPAKSVPWFRRTRELVADDFHDTLGLAASSLGWEAQAELRQDHLERATALYLQQLSTGDATAVLSLHIVSERVLKSDLLHYASDKNLRRVVTAHLVSGRGTREHTLAWLVAIEATGNFQLTGTDRLAWAAYQAGNNTLAARWLKCAPADSPIAQWLRVKLLLRDGKLDEAAALLANIVRQFPHTDDWPGAYKVNELADGDSDYRPTPQQISGELAVLQMSRGQFTDSLDLLLRNNYWWDAAYIGERVLTPDELKQYVDQRWPKPECGSWDLEKFDATREIRWLLARRLARLDRFDEARPYYAARLQPEFDKYVAALRAGRDNAKPAAERAKGLFEAARQARWWGMTLLSTEGEPDYHAVEGSYEASLNVSNRLASTTLVTAVERQRAAQPPTKIAARFHYRYLAANLAWEAAQLMTDNSDDTARVLCEAGTWLKNRDPKSADRFYKALVKRCGTTELGKAADKKRWFPPVPDSADTKNNPVPSSE
jgi:hypothetical protein